MNILEFHNVFYETQEVTILKNANIEIREGDFAIITGPSGSGKSTFLKLINQLISPTSGYITYRSKNLLDYNPVELRRSIAMCFQMPYLFGSTVLDNLTFPFQIRKKAVDLEILSKTLKLLAIDNNFINKDVRNLSGGEKQRIALGRSLIFKPDILLLDEVTSALDEKNTLIVEAAINDLNRNGVTVLWITHNTYQESRLNGRRLHIEKGVLREANK